MIGEWLRSDAEAGQGRTRERVAGGALYSPTHNVGKNSGERNAPNAAYVPPHTVCADLFVDSANVPGKLGFNGSSYALQVFAYEKLRDDFHDDRRCDRPRRCVSIVSTSSRSRAIGGR